jgi:hypothetical protein
VTRKAGKISFRIADYLSLIAAFFACVGRANMLGGAGVEFKFRN